MSQEIINVLNHLGEQLGIAIDWTAENVWPQVMDILGRYRLLEIISIAMWIFVEVAAMAFALIVAVANGKIRATKEDNFWWYKGYSSIYMSGVGFALTIVAAIFGFVSLFLLPIDVKELLRWAIVPEIQYLEMLKGLVN